MNIKTLIAAVVRQTTVLLAQIATTAGARAPLADVADRVFLELVHELESQGVTRKVAADMFGLALRSYQKKVQRLSLSATDSGVSLWEAVLNYVRNNGRLQRSQILHRFRRDDDALVRSVLADLARTGLIHQEGRTEEAVYVAATEEELGALGRSGEQAGTELLIWHAVYIHGPLAQSKLLELVPVDPGPFELAIDALVASERVVRGPEADPVLETNELYIPVGSPVGWEAAVFDHFQALVSTLCARLDSSSSPRARDGVGGSTYTLDVWRGHPKEAEVLGLLREHREKLSALRAEVDAFNREHPRPRNYRRVTFYFGQNTRAAQANED
jgi:hypothetical protein